jgi:hypothetical protein
MRLASVASRMADDMEGRADQAQREEQRQRRRAVEEALERGEEPEPPVEEPLAADALEPVSFPATAAGVVAAAGDRTVRAGDAEYAVADLLPETDTERFPDPDDVLERVARPTVAAAMKRVVEAGEDLSDPHTQPSQYEAYEQTFRALRAVDAVDDDAVIDEVADWLVERIEEKGTLPGSRQVRRQAAKVVRSHGYEIRTDEWLGA